MLPHSLLLLLSTALLYTSAAPVKQAQASASRSSLPFKQIVVFGAQEFAKPFTTLEKATDSAEKVRRNTCWQQFANTLQVPLIDYTLDGSTTDNSLVEGPEVEAGSLLASTMDAIEDYTVLNADSDLPGESLFVISTGSNDHIYDPEIQPSALAARVEDMVRQLMRIGARSFILVAPPPMASSEEEDLAVSYRSDFVAESASDLFTHSFRHQLYRVSRRLSSSLRTSHRLDIIFVDFYFFYQSIFARPEEFSFDENLADLLKEPCTSTPRAPLRHFAINEDSAGPLKRPELFMQGRLERMEGQQIQLIRQRPAMEASRNAVASYVKPAPVCTDAHNRLYYDEWTPSTVANELMAGEILRSVEVYMRRHNSRV